MKQNVSESETVLPSKQKKYFQISRPKWKKKIFSDFDLKQKILLDSSTQTKKYFQIPRPKQKRIFFRFQNSNEAFPWPNPCCCFQLVDCFVSWLIVSSAESRSWKWNKMFRNQKQFFHPNKKIFFRFLDPNKKKIFSDFDLKQKNIFRFLDPNKKKTFLDSSTQTKK